MKPPSQRLLTGTQKEFDAELEILTAKAKAFKLAFAVKEAQQQDVTQAQQQDATQAQEQEQHQTTTPIIPPEQQQQQQNANEASTWPVTLSAPPIVVTARGRGRGRARGRGRN